jgi:hypothetical protein
MKDRKWNLERGPKPTIDEATSKTVISHLALVYILDSM